MGEKLRRIDIELLNKLSENYRPKIIDTRIENGIQVKVYEPRFNAGVLHTPVYENVKRK